MSQSSKTSAPLMQPSCETLELFPSGSLPVGPAKTSALRAQDLAWTEHARDYGAKSPVWLANWTSTDCSWRTAQTSLLSTAGLTLAEFSGTWPRSGSMRNGTAYLLPPLTHPTSVIASGSWRTDEELLPTLHGVGKPGSPRRAGPPGNELGREVNIRERALMPTLTKADGTGGPGRSEKRKGGDNLRTHVAMMPTLVASDVKGSVKGETLMKRMSHSRGVRLSEHIQREVEMLPTLTATRRSGLQSHGENAILGSLNPTWCEWFMGLPTGHTELPRSET